jgi:hypothetical protein
MCIAVKKGGIDELPIMKMDRHPDLVDELEADENPQRRHDDPEPIGDQVRGVQREGHDREDGGQREADELDPRGLPARDGEEEIQRQQAGPRQGGGPQPSVEERQLQDPRERLAAGRVRELQPGEEVPVEPVVAARTGGEHEQVECTSEPKPPRIQLCPTVMSNSHITPRKMRVKAIAAAFEISSALRNMPVCGSTSAVTVVPPRCCGHRGLVLDHRVQRTSPGTGRAPDPEPGGQRPSAGRRVNGPVGSSTVRWRGHRARHREDLIGYQEGRIEAARFVLHDFTLDRPRIARSRGPPPATSSTSAVATIHRGPHGRALARAD